MILIVTEQFDPHADFVIDELRKRDIRYRRLHLSEFPSNASISLSNFSDKSTIVFDKFAVNVSDIKSVWYRRTESPVIKNDISPENKVFAKLECNSLVISLWHSLKNAYWISDPWAIRRADSKYDQLIIAKLIGFNVPKTYISNDPNFINQNIKYLGEEVIYKPFTPIMIPKSKNRTGVVYTHLLKKTDFEKLDQISQCPGIFQEYISKSFDIRITIFGKTIFASKINSQSKSETQVDSRASKWTDSDSPKIEAYELPHDLKEKCHKLVSHYGLLFGTIDLVVDRAGQYIFLELNPNGQWAWIEQETNQPMRNALINLLRGERNE